MVYLYAIVGRWATVPEQSGIAGCPVESVPIENLAAVIGEVAGAVDATEQQVLAHARIVDELAEANDAVLPVRFGRGFQDLDRLEAALMPLAPRLEERLRSVSGCVEIGLHVVARRESAARGESGRDYMQRRLRQLAHEEAVAEAIHAPLAERAREATRSHGVGASALLRAAYLVGRADVEAFRTCVADTQQQYSTLSFSCTGPWAPYSFAAFEEEAA